MLAGAGGGVTGAAGDGAAADGDVDGGDVDVDAAAAGGTAAGAGLLDAVPGVDGDPAGASAVGRRGSVTRFTSGEMRTRFTSGEMSTRFVSGWARDAVAVGGVCGSGARGVAFVGALLTFDAAIGAWGAALGAALGVAL